MKILRKNKYINKKVVIIGFASLLILGGAAITYVYAFNGNLFGWTKDNDDSQTYKEATDEQKKEGERQKRATANLDGSNENKPSAQGSDTPPPPTQHSNGTKQVGVTITAANQTPNTLQIRSMIDTVQAKGECTLTLEKAGRQPIIKTAGIQSLSNTSTCQGFDVPIYELSAGVWTITLDYENSSLTGRATTTITIT